MHRFIEEKNWEGTAEALASHARDWMRLKGFGDPSFQPNERLIRDYVARNILSKPERKGKEAIFGFEQLVQFLACRAMIEDGWPLSKISQDFQVSSLEDILKLVPGEATQNEALSLIENFKEETFEPSAKISASYGFKKSKGRPTEHSEKDESNSPSFLKRSRESYETRADIKDVLHRLGSDFGNVIREDFTAYQLASWLVLLIDRDKASGITRQDAEDIGRGITAALLNRSSLTKADRSSYTKQMKDLAMLDDQLRNREYELKQIHNEFQAKEEMLKSDFERRQYKLRVLEEKIQIKRHKLAEVEEKLREAGEKGHSLD
jgi:hypothetical protein